MRKLPKGASGRQLAFCPDGHGVMFYMAQSKRYHCSHQSHDATGSRKFWSESEADLLRVNPAKRG